jgi:hypothetical protein
MYLRSMRLRGLLFSAMLFFVLSGCYDINGTFGHGDDDTEPHDEDDDDSGSGDDDDPTPGDDDDTTTADQDGDGWEQHQDCDDLDAQVYPGAQELCNERDDDCDKLIDEDVLESWFVDLDGDEYGADSSLLQTCDPLPGMISQGGDCDDDDSTIYPGSPEQVDGADSDCDGALDWLVTIYVGTDDAGELCVDTWDNLLGATGGWTSGTIHEIWLASGPHAIGIKGWDTGQVITAAIAHVEISTGQQWLSDASWRYDPNPSASEKSRIGWCEPYFDDSNWDLVRDLGPIGSSPWHGHSPSVFPTSSSAHWIWDHFPVNLNTQYLRREFVLP